jgi:hypothetical protein
MIRASGGIPRNCIPRITSAFMLTSYQMIRSVCLMGGVAVSMTSKLQARAHKMQTSSRSNFKVL